MRVECLSAPQVLSRKKLKYYHPLVLLGTDIGELLLYETGSKLKVLSIIKLPGESVVLGINATWIMCRKRR